MSENKSSPRYSTCRVCGRVIADTGSGWYHTGIRLQPGHFAEPMAVAAR